jgi:hypothetical protein
MLPEHPTFEFGATNPAVEMQLPFVHVLQTDLPETIRGEHGHIR